MACCGLSKCGEPETLAQPRNRATRTAYQEHPGPVHLWDGSDFPHPSHERARPRKGIHYRASRKRDAPIESLSYLLHRKRHLSTLNAEILQHGKEGIALLLPYRFQEEPSRGCGPYAPRSM